MKTYDSAFDALEDDNEIAANLKLRSTVLRSVREQVRRWGVPQQKAAAVLGLSQPRLSDLMNAKIEKFSLDSLVNLAHSAGIQAHIQTQRPRSKALPAHAPRKAAVKVASRARRSSAAVA